MNRETVLALNRINCAFYRSAAARFSATRRTAWPGFARVVRRLRQTQLRAAGAPRILDLGCGNGRFADALLEAFGDALAYLGVDASQELVAEARGRHRDHPALRFEVHDFVESPADRWLGGRRFQAVVLFGVLHHVPGAETRRELLTALAQHLEPGGVLAFSIWRFAHLERFRGRFLAWPAFAERTGAHLDLGELEPGDHLLPFGDAEDPPRYCHALDDVEARALVASLGLDPLDDFESDGEGGKLNRYVLLRRPCAGPLRSSPPPRTPPDRDDRL